MGLDILQLLSSMEKGVVPVALVVCLVLLAWIAGKAIKRAYVDTTTIHKMVKNDHAAANKEDTLEKRLKEILNIIRENRIIAEDEIRRLESLIERAIRNKVKSDEDLVRQIALTSQLDAIDRRILAIEKEKKS